MKITQLAKLISGIEGGAQNLSIAQIMEVLKAIETISNGLFYKLVKALL